VCVEGDIIASVSTKTPIYTLVLKIDVRKSMIYATIILLHTGVCGNKATIFAIMQILLSKVTATLCM